MKNYKNTLLHIHRLVNKHQMTRLCVMLWWKLTPYPKWLVEYYTPPNLKYKFSWILISKFNKSYLKCHSEDSSHNRRGIPSLLSLEHIVLAGDTFVVKILSKVSNSSYVCWSSFFSFMISFSDWYMLYWAIAIALSFTSITFVPCKARKL